MGFLTFFATYPGFTLSWFQAHLSVANQIFVPSSDTLFGSIVALHHEPLLKNAHHNA